MSFLIGIGLCCVGIDDTLQDCLYLPFPCVFSEITFSYSTSSFVLTHRLLDSLGVD